jgi:hypothetical protein
MATSRNIHFTVQGANCLAPVDSWAETAYQTRLLGDDRALVGRCAH